MRRIRIRINERGRGPQIDRILCRSSGDPEDAMDHDHKRKKFDLKNDKYLLFQIAFFGGAVLINFILPRLATYFNVPLYLDNVGTLLAAVLGGYLPGIFVGYLNNIINMQGNPGNAYYVVLSTMIAASGTYFGQKGYFDKFRRAVVTIPVFAFIGGVLGSIITYLIYGFGMGEGISAPFARRLLESGKLSVFWAQMTSDIVIDLADKGITVILVFIIIKLIPDRLKPGLWITGWRQTPMSQEELLAARKSMTRSFSLRSKIIAIISVIMLTVAVVTTFISYLLYENFSMRQYTYSATSAARLAANLIDPEKTDEYLTAGESDAGYVKLEKKLDNIRSGNPDIEFIYVYRFEDDGVHVVFDLDTPEVKGVDPGKVIPMEDYLMPFKDDLLAGNPVEPILDDTMYGALLTVFEPVYDDSGKCVCYAAADIKVEDIRKSSINYMTKVFSLFIGFYILILSLCIWLVDYHLIYPIAAMTVSARKFAYDSEEAREISVERLQHLDISTGDEIENLYESLSKTIAETVGYLEDVEAKSEEISRMQNGLIYVLADMVESRDKNTGDHVRKTAAYVRLILDKMKEKGVYADELTYEFIEDVVNSAPLHDVGKIMVSDTILNKKGRLTDEEFAQMKNHTTAGSKVLASAMTLVSDSGYLKEAKNLATYHHERWDGKGYPSGKSSDQIPLSARIMAVADVFDALVSKRSYKEPFPFEKAMEIIEEGAGEQFDPEIAKIFIESADEVRAISEAHAAMLGQGIRTFTEEVTEEFTEEK
ncbi:MAG: HD domain-containing protein [Lachnospiraceae bacterium]|nr:HD domain-containing protein [Lachnospiraceae bacterium]